MNKKLIIVCLAASAFLLPAIAGAVVNGPCVQCHTMHDSQNGLAENPAGPNGNLLRGVGCVGCHAGQGGNVLATGVSGAPLFAPQVDDSANTNNGGYFDIGASDTTHHNVADFLAENADALISTIPGGTGTTISGTSPVIGCDSCHTQATHHQASANVYRMLAPAFSAVYQTEDLDYGATNGGSGIGDRENTSYDAAAMNLVCAGCHPDFHGGVPANQDGAVIGDGIWVRHPTDISIATEFGTGNAPSVAGISGVLTFASDSDAIPLGRSVAGNDIIMCITCHNAHGSDYADLLTYNYALEVAGDSGTQATGCESCHSYGITGM